MSAQPPESAPEGALSSIPAEAVSDSVGLRLLQARERMGLSQQQVADKLKLDKHMVVALEQGNYAVIGAAVFVRGFLRRYAALVGVAQTDVDALYARQADSVRSPDLANVAVHALPGETQGRALGVWPALVAALLLCAVAAIWWAKRPSAHAPGAAAQSTTGPAAAAVASQNPGSASASGGGAPAAAPPGVRPLGTAGHLGARANAGETAAAAAAAATAAQAAATSAATSAAAMEAARVAGLPRKALQVTFNGEGWAEIYDARGMRLLFGFGHAGTSQSLSGVPPFRVVLGNAAATALNVAGVDVAVPAAAPGARLRFRLSGVGDVSAVR